MQLSDNEIRDITRLLEEGKPLPDKYRFMLFGDDREIELVWNGKSGDVKNVVLPFQTIEHVDEPRSEEDVSSQPDLFDLATGRQLKGWTNKLIWGDNNFILSSLKNGPLREEIEANGGIKFIYIDPPFDVGADFKMDIDIGDEVFEKDANVLEELAYRDTWGKGDDSFLAMIYDSISLMHGLLSERGVIAVHCDWHIAAELKLVLMEIFGKSNFINEIVWHYYNKMQGNVGRFASNHDSILLFSKSKTFQFTQIKEERDKPIKQQKRVWDPKTKSLKQARDADGNLVYYMEKYRTLDDVWRHHYLMPANKTENLKYPTQKPEELARRLISAFTSEGDIVCDFFVGSGTTSAVAEKLGRKWICSDLGKFSIHTARKRLIGVQRDLKKEGMNYRAFEVLNLGKYEREFFVSGLSELDEKAEHQVENNRELAFNSLILQAYQAEPVSGFRTFRGKKNNRVIAIGPVNMPISRLFAEQVVSECVEKGITKADILAFEFEMGLFPSIQDEASNKGVDLVLKHIPKEVFDKRSVSRGEAKFHDVAYIEVRPIVDGNKVSIELTNYSVFYTQGITSLTEENLKSGKSQIVVENGQVLKISKDKDGITNPREVLTKNWHDWVDYWSIDFDFESKKELIYQKNPSTGQDELKWTGSYIFENEWQSFRTKQDRSIELKSIPYEMQPGRKKIAIKVVDIFGNDTMKVIDLTIGGKI